MSAKSVPAGTQATLVGMFSGLGSAPGTGSVMRRLGGWVRPALTAAGFDGSHGQTAVLPDPEGGLGRVVFVGLGDELDLEALRQAAAAARRAVDKADTLATTLHRVGLDGAPGAVIDGLAMASYRFDIYKSAAPTRPEPTVALVGSAPEWEEAAARSREVVAAVSLARDLVNEPSINKPPMVMARRLADEATAAGMTAEIWDAGRLAEERMGGILGVGAGSDRPPCLLRLSHRPKRKRPRSRLAFVGKGIVFDTGGISIKPADRMEEMKADMAGAAAVCAAAIAISRLGLPVEVSAYAALAENMPSGAAQRPGDVLTARNGKTIEVINTDAEGRLVLADAIALAAESFPDVIVDLATLTGACKVALGPKIAGVLGNDQAWIDRVLAAARSVGERVWQLPLPSDHRSMIDSDVADMKNTGGSRYGGAITAALLLAEFPGETPWVHLDIAGPAYGDKTEHYLPKGGTGFGVRTLVELAEAAS